LKNGLWGLAAVYWIIFLTSKALQGWGAGVFMLSLRVCFFYLAGAEAA
jgi:hypothetical protein